MLNGEAFEDGDTAAYVKGQETPTSMREVFEALLSPLCRLTSPISPALQGKTIRLSDKAFLSPNPHITSIFLIVRNNS